MNMSTRGPLRGNDTPFVMHLERVCRLIEMGQKFTIEFNPCSDIVETMGNMIESAGISILTDGRVSTLHTELADLSLLDGRVCIHRPSGYGAAVANLSLANYKRVWRCWQNGAPTDAQRRAVKWG